MNDFNAQEKVLEEAELEALVHEDSCQSQKLEVAPLVNLNLLMIGILRIRINRF